MAQNERFHSHYNEAMGKMVHTKKDYLDTMKKMNLIPQREGKQIAEAKQREMNKPYKTSDWAHGMVQHVKDTNGKPGSRFYDELAKKGYTRERIAKSKQQYDKNFKDGNNY